ncbi:p23 chaperone protein wos2 [Pseudogymnoascus australis]
MTDWRPQGYKDDAPPSSRGLLWAQRSNATEPEKNYIYLTISVPDCKPEDLKLDLKPTGLTFSGKSDSLKKSYHVELELFAEIDVENSKINHTSKNVELVLRKKEAKEEFWPRLLKDSKKVHYLKTDFDKWVDEDEQEEAPEEDLGGMGGMPPGGMGGMGGMGGGAGGMGGMDMASMMSGMGGGGGDFGGIDFSKLGAMGGAGGMGDMDDEGEGEDDDELPALEEQEGAAKAKSSDSKIEEIN